MARPRHARSNERLPEPLPPEHRTVGQLVAESLRIYGAHFWRALALGLPVALLNVIGSTTGRSTALVVIPVVGAVLVTASYVAGCSLVTGVPLRSRSAALAFLVGAVVFLPFPFLAVFYILPGLAYLSLVGLAVPAALVEGLSPWPAVKRSVELARADYVHVLGSLATLTILVVVVQGVLAFLLREYAENTERAAAAVASIVLSPMLFLGSAVLYGDQEARLRLRPKPR